MRLPFVRRDVHEQVCAERDRLHTALREALGVASRALSAMTPEPPAFTPRERDMEPVPVHVADQMYLQGERERRLRPGEDRE